MISLGKNEHELTHVKKHWYYFFWPVVWTLLTTGLLLPWLIYRIAVYNTDEFIITDHKIHLSHGIISKTSESIPLEKLNDIHYDQGFIGRFLGFGTVWLQSGAANSGHGFSCIADPARVKGVIEDALERKEDTHDRRLAGYIGDAVRR